MKLNRAIAWVRSRAGSLSRQLALAVAIVVAPVLIALFVVGWQMVVSSHDAVLIGVIVIVAGAIAVVVSKLVADGMLRDVMAIRDGLNAVGRGERDVVIETTVDDELAQLAREANAMIVRLRAEESARDQSEGARRSLVASVSHDLRTPITSLRLLAQAVEDDIVDGDTRRAYLARMRTHIDALSALIDDLFELSRLEAGDISWSLERVPLAELVGETVEAMRVQAEAKGVAVVAEIPPSLLPARANPEKVQRVLFNLIQNAIRHTPADGSVVVRAEPVADRIEVEVADTGDGIAPDEREHVFTAFYRGGASAARTGAAPGSGWRCHARSSRPTAGRSGWRTRRPVPASASACPWRPEISSAPAQARRRRERRPIAARDAMIGPAPMSTELNARVTIGRAVRDARRFDRSRVSIRAGLIAAIPVAGSLAFGTAIDRPDVAVTMGAGAMLGGVAWRAAGPDDPPIGTMAAAVASLGLATVAGSASGRYPWLHVALLAVLTACAGLLVSLGRRGSVPGTQAIIAYVVFGRFPQPLDSALGLAGLVVAGGAVQAVFATVVGLPPAWRQQREAVAEAYRQLAMIASQLGATSVPAAAALDAAELKLNAPTLLGDPALMTL